MIDHPKRSLVKAVTWRITGFIVTVLVVFLYNKDLKTSLIAVTSADLIKVFLYYFHERFWNKLQFGRLKITEYEI